MLRQPPASERCPAPGAVFAARREVANGHGRIGRLVRAGQADRHLDRQEVERIGERAAASDALAERDHDLLRSAVDGHRRTREAIEHPPGVADHDGGPDPAPAGDLASSAGSLVVSPVVLVQDPPLELADLRDRPSFGARAWRARERDSLDRRGGLRPAGPADRPAARPQDRSGGRPRPARRQGRGRGARPNPTSRDRDRTRSTGRRAVTPGEAGQALVNAQRGIDPSACRVGPGVGPDLEGRLVALGGGPRPRVRDGEDAHRHRQHQQQRRPRVAQRATSELAATRATGPARGRRLRRVRPSWASSGTSGGDDGARQQADRRRRDEQRIEPERALDGRVSGAPYMAELPEADRGDRHERQVEPEALADPDRPARETRSLWTAAIDRVVTKAARSGREGRPRPPPRRRIGVGRDLGLDRQADVRQAGRRR